MTTYSFLMLALLLESTPGAAVYIKYLNIPDQMNKYLNSVAINK